jgi:hypothetical protein
VACHGPHRIVIYPPPVIVHAIRPHVDWMDGSIHKQTRSKPRRRSETSVMARPSRSAVCAHVLVREHQKYAFASWLGSPLQTVSFHSSETCSDWCCHVCVDFLCFMFAPATSATHRRKNRGLSRRKVMRTSPAAVLLCCSALVAAKSAVAEEFGELERKFMHTANRLPSGSRIVVIDCGASK